MENKYVFHNILVFLWKSDEDIEKFVNNSLEEKMNIYVEFYSEGIKKTIAEIIEKAGFLPEDTILVTDDREAAYSAAGLGIAVVGYKSCFSSEVKYVIEDIAEVDEHFFNMVYQRKHNIPVTILETEHTVIREIRLEDLPQMYELYSKEGVREWVEPLYEYEEELEFTKAYIENMYVFYGYGLWLVFDKVTGELIGRAGISNRVIDGEEQQELGYIIDADRQGRGLGYEVGKAIIEYAWEYLGFEKLYLCTKPDNLASIALAKKLGFEYYGENEEFVIYIL